MVRGKSNILLTAIATLVIIVLIGGLIVAYLTSPEPVFYLEDLDHSIFNKDKEESFKLNLYNKGEVHGLATLSLSSREFVFRTQKGDPCLFA